MDNSNISRNPWALGSFDASMIPFDPRLLSPLFQYQKQDQENETGISGFGQEQTAPSDLNGSVKRSVPVPSLLTIGFQPYSLTLAQKPNPSHGGL